MYNDLNKAQRKTRPNNNWYYGLVSGVAQGRGNGSWEFFLAWILTVKRKMVQSGTDPGRLNWWVLTHIWLHACKNYFERKIKLNKRCCWYIYYSIFSPIKNKLCIYAVGISADSLFWVFGTERCGNLGQSARWQRVLDIVSVVYIEMMKSWNPLRSNDSTQHLIIILLLFHSAFLLLRPEAFGLLLQLLFSQATQVFYASISVLLSFFLTRVTLSYFNS